MAARSMRAVSWEEFIVGILVLITGLVIYSFAPGGLLFVPPPDHINTHFVGAALAIIFGLLGWALYRRMSWVGIGMWTLTIISGIVFLLDAPTYPLYEFLQPHDVAMRSVGGLITLWGVIGMISSYALGRKVEAKATQ